MTAVLLRMAHLDDPAVWRETAVPNITPLRELGRTIQEAFALDGEGVIEYEVLGCRAPGGRARLRDLIASGVTRFRYLQSSAPRQKVDIVIIPLPRTHLERPAAGSSERPSG